MFEQLTDKEKLIYFAGLIDGEGHIGCQYYGNRKRPVIQLQMTNREVVLLFANYFNIKFRELNSPSHKQGYEKGYKQMYQARAECKKAHPIIKEIYTYLIVKKIDAETAMQYYEHEDRICLMCSRPIGADRNIKSKYCCVSCYNKAKSRRSYNKEKGR